MKSQTALLGDDLCIESAHGAEVARGVVKLNK